MAYDKEARIIELPESDIHGQSRSKKVNYFKWQAKTAIICISARTVLLFAYASCITQATALDQKEISLIGAYAFLIMETMFFLYRLYPQYIQSIQHCPKARLRPRLWIEGEQVPTVDVLIFYCGEEMDVLLDTVRAACSLDYPSDRFRVVVLDDSNSAQTQVESLKASFANLSYSARMKKDGAWHKAGNINHGLTYVSSLGPMDMVAGLDVDMIPEKGWLRRLVPHLSRDEKLGLVSPNQRFYNTPLGDPLGQLLQYDQLQSVRQIRRDFGEEGLGAGSGWLARRRALDSIGGFSCDGIAEDFLTCVDLREAGWKVILLDEDVQWGLTSDSFNAHTKLYSKWTTVMLSFYESLSGPERPRNQMAFKVVAESSTLAYMTGMVICYFGIPIMSLCGYSFIRVANDYQLRVLTALAFVDFLAQTAQGLLESATADFTIYSWHEPSHLWHIPLFITPTLRRFIPWASQQILGKAAIIKPAGSMSNRSTEDSTSSRWSRLRILLIECQVLLHLFVITSCLAGLTVFALHVWSRYESKRELFFYMVTHIGWPPALYFWTSTLKNACRPFFYALFVPPRQPREAHLSRDEKTLLAYPTVQAKDLAHRRVSEWHLCLILMYWTGILLVSWEM